MIVYWIWQRFIGHNFNITDMDYMVLCGNKKNWYMIYMNSENCLYCIVLFQDDGVIKFFLVIYNKISSITFQWVFETCYGFQIRTK